MSAGTRSVLPPADELPLFVYGTLMTGFRNHDKLLAPHIKETRPACIEDVSLWHVKDAGYPVIIPGTGTVKGELIYLKDFAAAIPGLDLLEGYTGDPRESTYVRLIKPVVDLETGAETDAHIYWYNRSVAEIRGPVIEIPEGDWRVFMDEETLDEGMRVLGEKQPEARDS